MSGSLFAGIIGGFIALQGVFGSPFSSTMIETYSNQTFRDVYIPHEVSMHTDTMREKIPMGSLRDNTIQRRELFSGIVQEKFKELSTLHAINSSA